MVLQREQARAWGGTYRPGRVNELSRQQERKGYVYLAKAESGQYKIGVSKDPKKRVDGLKTQSPSQVTLTHCFFADDMRMAEKQLHAMFSEQPRTFDEGTYQRWKPILKGPWRFALDEMRELDDVERMMKILKSEPSGRKRVYVLIGNEPIETCHERALKVIEWGGEPYCQPLMPLNALSRDSLKVRHDWTIPKLKDFARYFNRFGWRQFPLNQYRPRRHEKAPFAP